MKNNFLEAEWRKLVMINYVVDKEILIPYLPFKTELDFWNNECYISLVGFMFMNTRIKGFRVPFHVNFEEVNLRFYVRYKENEIWKRGVVFIKEIVPKVGITLVANMLYNEHYETMPMAHSWMHKDDKLIVEYQWEKARWNKIKVIAERKISPIYSETQEEFITEHFWGYTRINEKNTSEYGVEHPRWEIYNVIDFTIDVDFKSTYGDNFEFLAKAKPSSVFLAEGSDIKVLKKSKSQ